MSSNTPSGSREDGGGIFPQTRWSMVISARDSQDQAHTVALEELCRIYWRPVYLFIRSRGNSPEQSEDLAQEFFYRLLHGNQLSGVDGPEKGRLRSFLCVVLKRFLIDEYDKSMTRKRGGGWKAIPIDGPAAEAQLALMQPGETSPDTLFDRHWALDLLDQTVARLKADYVEAGKAELFEKLKPTISMQLESPPYAQLAGELGLSEGAVKVAVHRFRQRYRDRLRETLRETLENPEETDEELQYLISLFSRSRVP